MRHHTPILSVSLVYIACIATVYSATTVIPKNTPTTEDPDIVSPFDKDYELKRTPEQIDAALKKLKIIPDLLDKAPNETIYVEWIDGPCVLLGNEITEVHDLECRPLWVNYKNFLRQQHTMIMIGLDEPSPKNRSSSFFLYWLVGNIPPHDWDNVPATDYVMGETLVDYREPLPLHGTGLHRYVFLVYAHENRTIKFEMPKLAWRNVTERLNFSLKDFVKKYDLGEPYAVNCFVAQWQLPPYRNATDEPTSATPFIEETTTVKQNKGKRIKKKKRKGLLRGPI